MSDASVTVQEAQAEIDGTKVAEILRDFQHNFRGVYPDYVLARGVGPEQAMIGLAIKRGHLFTIARTDTIPAALIEAERRGMMRGRAELLKEQKERQQYFDLWASRGTE